MLNRVLLTTDTVGGVWRYTMEIAHGLSLRAIEVILAVLGPAPTIEQQREAAAVPRSRIFVKNLPLDWLAETPEQVEDTARALAAMAAEVRADTIQLHAPALVGYPSWPAPVVAVVHSCIGTWWQAVRGGPLPADLAWQAEATQRGIDRADYVVAPSRSFAAALRVRYGIVRPVEVVLNGRSPRAKSRTQRKHALTAGRLWDAGKNVATLDAAASRLDWPVRAAGPSVGPNGARISCSHLQLLGPLDEAALAGEYADASIFVSTALYEPFGLAVLEAAQAGCALVLSDIPTFRELWDDAAIFVPPHGVDRVASTLEDLRSHPSRCTELGQEARIRSGAYSSRRMADAMWDIHVRAAAGMRSAA